MKSDPLDGSGNRLSCTVLFQATGHEVRLWQQEKQTSLPGGFFV